MKKQTIITLTIIILVGVLLGLGVYFGLNAGTEQVVVPSREIKAGETFTAENLEIITIPKAITLDGVMIKKPEDILGMTALSALVAGEPITQSKLSSQPSDGFLNNMEDPVKNYTITFPIPADRPLKSISMGDYVSIFSTMVDKEENVVTSQVGGKYKVVGVEETEDGVIPSITIEVTPEEMPELTHVVMNADYMLTYVTRLHEVQQIIPVIHEDAVKRKIENAIEVPFVEAPETTEPTGDVAP